MRDNDSRCAHAALTINATGEIASWNAGCEALFGLDAKAALGQRLDERLDQASRQACAACFGVLPVQCDCREVRIVRGDGAVRRVRLSLIPAFNAAGVHTGGVAFFTAEPGESDSAAVGRMPLRSVIDALPGSFYVVRPDGSFVLWNKSLEKAAAMSPAEVRRANALDLCGLAEKRMVAARMRHVFEHGTQLLVEANCRNKHGHDKLCLMYGARIDCGGRHYLCGMALDLSGRRAHEDRLRLRERALHAASRGLVITRCNGADNPIEYANPAFERITGYPVGEVLGRDPRFMAVPGLDDDQRALLRDAIRERRELNVTLRNRRKDGQIFWNDLAITPVSDERGRVTHFIGVMTDFTAVKQRTARLEYELSHDTATGLANRNLLWERLEQAIHVAQRGKVLVALLLVDLDSLRQINDAFGRAAGDAVLDALARRLQASVRDCDTVARVSASQFVLVLANQPSQRYTRRMIERVRAGLFEPVQVEACAQPIPIEASVGVGTYPHDGSNALELMRAADAAMRHARAGGKNEVHFYSAAWQEHPLPGG
jgi:diguanylate cyclase (GGDEF)-like protein/PAS domain S-box-containing protein